MPVPERLAGSSPRLLPGGLRRRGTAATLSLIDDLLDLGCAGFHCYTFNRRTRRSPSWSTCASGIAAASTGAAAPRPDRAASSHRPPQSRARLGPRVLERVPRYARRARHAQ
ncbi:hypothetical protein QJS66_11910 [Kocuria rhizophila]|nr:hypothetical protein QJS66_11910 [Kocuria rhizophila]